MQDPSLRTYRIAFLGRNASGNLPMFTGAGHDRKTGDKSVY
ncbi:hypothetical protein BANRA_05717 [Klebsiella pneumoniae]|nr:hypothetical protein BANRA_05717 [Klebsiella pneumoniae]